MNPEPVQVLEGDGTGMPIGEFVHIDSLVPLSTSYQDYHADNKVRRRWTLTFHRYTDVPQLFYKAERGEVSIALTLDSRLAFMRVLIPGIDCKRIEEIQVSRDTQGRRTASFFVVD